ncbi:MAG: class II glutamine amidotransferase [Sedimenticola sp.]
MCELFALSSLYVTNISFSLEEFADHGGQNGPHKDGWGVAHYEHRDVRLIREPFPASTSPCVRFLQEHGFKSNIIISHIRMATVGERQLRNTQPFSRALGGRMHTFAHNGDLDGIINLPEFETGRWQPIGETDSEHAYCHLMHLMEPLWEAGEPSLKARYRVLEGFAERLRPLGPANFIYSDGDYVFAHGDKRTQPGQEGYHPPGLHWLSRTCGLSDESHEISGVTLQHEQCDQAVTLVATVPLTDEAWQPMDEGEILVMKDGTIQHP